MAINESGTGVSTHNLRLPIWVKFDIVGNPREHLALLTPISLFPIVLPRRDLTLASSSVVQRYVGYAAGFLNMRLCPPLPFRSLGQDVNNGSGRKLRCS